METKTLALTTKEIIYLRELVDVVSPSYGPTFNTEEWHYEYEETTGSVFDKAQIEILYGKLVDADKGKAWGDKLSLTIAKTVALECRRKAAEQLKWLDDEIEKMEAELKD